MIPASRTIPVAVKRAVLLRDGMTCFWCGCTVITRNGGHEHVPNLLHFDHVEPWAAGGEHSVDNLVVSCATCNLSRPRPSVNVRVRPMVERHHGRYWWIDGFEPPRLIADNECGWELGNYAAATRRETVESLVRAIVRGDLAATGQGEAIHVAPPIGYETVRERRRREVRDARARQAVGQ